MTSQSNKRGSISVKTSQATTQGNLNKGFELSSLDGDEEANVVMVEEFEVDQSGIDGSNFESDYESDFEDDEVHPVLTIRRVSYQPPEELPSEDWKKEHGAFNVIEEEEEELVEDIKGNGGREVEMEMKENEKLKVMGNEEIRDAEEERKDDNKEELAKVEENEEKKVERNEEEDVKQKEEEVQHNEKKEEVDQNEEEEEVKQAVGEMEKKPTYANGHRPASDVAELILENDVS